MKALAPKVAVLLLALAGTFPARAADHQAWIRFSADAKVFGDFTLRVDEELRYGHGALVVEELTMSGSYRLASWLSASVGHCIARDRKGGHGPLQTVQRPLVDFTFYAPAFARLKPDFRTRFELCDHHGEKPFMRYRERLRLRTDWSVTDFKISPYCYEEVFLVDRPGRENVFDQNRFQAGVSLKPLPSVPALSCNLYYMLQHSLSPRGSQWRATHIYGLELAYSF
ncbi:MAG: DUF2490 domain-containing protein [Kiritimatiellae bacterium]|nr:DUF2490 domain-containing protein [Kiritimatiellia bacterium]